MKSFTLSIGLALLSTGLLPADHPAAPDGAVTEGSSGGNFTAALISQQLYVPADLSGLNVGDVITGISLRLNGAAGMFATTTFARFDFRLGSGNVSLTSTLANNFAGPATVVRSGDLALRRRHRPAKGGGPIVVRLPTIEFGAPLPP